MTTPIAGAVTNHPKARGSKRSSVANARPMQASTTSFCHKPPSDRCW